MLGLASGGGLPATAPSGVVVAVVDDVNDPEKTGQVRLRFPWLGDTYVSGASLPIVNGAQTTQGGGPTDVFLAKIDTTKNGAASLVYSTFLGGTGQEIATGIAYTGNGQVVVVGWTRYGDFPTKNAFQNAYGSAGTQSDGFIAKYDTTQTGAASKLRVL